MGEYRIICFEGSEAVGKSTLKQKFEKETNFRHLCIDRMFITSLVYNKYKNRHPDLTQKLYEDLDKFMIEFNPLFVYLYVDKNIQKKRFEDRGDWYIKNNELEEIDNIYENIIKELKNKYPKNILILSNNDEKEMEQNIKNIEKTL